MRGDLGSPQRVGSAAPLHARGDSEMLSCLVRGASEYALRCGCEGVLEARPGARRPHRVGLLVPVTCPVGTVTRTSGAQ